MKILIGNRIPKGFFLSSGVGESDISEHCGSFHKALEQAGIERCNIMTYSSILPAGAEELTECPASTHGEVMESIMAIAHSRRGKRATAGLAWGWLRDKKTGEKKGGVVCEYHGGQDENRASRVLRDSIQEVYESGLDIHDDLTGVRVVVQSIVPGLRFGTAIVALCFCTYEVPVLDSKINRMVC